MEYDEPPEPTDDTFVPPPRGEDPVLEVKVSRYELGRMLDSMLKAAVDQHVGEAISEHVEKEVAKAVDALVKEISAETIRAHVQKTLAEGWQPVNQWGEPARGATPVTLSTVVRDGLLAMSKVPERGYNDRQQPASPIGAIVQEMAAAGVKDGLAPILAAAKEQLKTQLDLSIGKSLRLTLGELASG